MVEFLFLALGIAIGFVVCWLYIGRKHKDLDATEIEELGIKYEVEREGRVQAETELRIYKEQQNQNMKQMQDSFDALATKAMQNNNESFIQLARQTFDSYVSKANSEAEKGRLNIESLIKPLKESLDKHEGLVKNLRESSNQTFGSLKTYLEELGKSQKSLEKETGALVSALKSPKVRGRWGEIGLKRIVEFSGMSAYCDFDEQVNVNTDNGRLRPDMIVNLPHNKKIVVDSKVPLNAYLEAIEQEDEQTSKTLLADHAKAVANHMRELSTKAYWQQFDNTVDFVLLYIEVEPAFGAALVQNKELLAEAIRNRIVFATPTTLVTSLQTVSYTWKQHTATESAMKIWESGKEVYDRLSVFSEYLQKIGGNISSLTKTFNQAVGSWESRVMPGVRKLESLGTASGKKEVANPEQIEVSAREIPS